MRISEQIDFDVQSLKGYFEQLFLLEEQTSKIPPPTLVREKLGDQFIAENIAAFIRPDMTCNIYIVSSISGSRNFVCITSREGNLAYRTRTFEQGTTSMHTTSI